MAVLSVYNPSEIVSLESSESGSKMLGKMLQALDLEGHPRYRKWLITMVTESPKDRVVGPLPNGLNDL